MIPYRPDMELECSQDWGPFDDLMDHTSGPDFDLARLIVADMCGRCEIRKACHELNADEPWLKALNMARDECPECGKLFDQTRMGPARIYCTIKCRRAAEYQKRKARSATMPKRALSNVPDELRAAHAAHWRLQTQGVAKEDMPADVINGERAYQARRKRKARGKEEAA